MEYRVIPGIGPQDIAVIQSLLAAARVHFRVHEASGEVPDLLLVRDVDVPMVKTLLADYRIRILGDDLTPIPW